MATKHIRVRLSFTHESDHQIEETTGAVITGMTGNKTYPNPPVDLAEVQAALTVFTAAIAALPSAIDLWPWLSGGRRLSSRQHRRDVPLRHLSDGDASHLFHRLSINGGNRGRGVVRNVNELAVRRERHPERVH